MTEELKNRIETTMQNLRRNKMEAYFCENSAEACELVKSLIKEGDVIVTAGTGGVYPEGLLIGEVKSIEFNSYDASRSAVIKPFEDVRSITSAAVITGFASSGKVVRADEN